MTTKSQLQATATATTTIEHSILTGPPHSDDGMNFGNTPTMQAFNRVTTFKYGTLNPWLPSVSGEQHLPTNEMESVEDCLRSSVLHDHPKLKLCQLNEIDC